MTLKLTGETAEVAHTQTHHTFMNRDFVVQETTFRYHKNPSEHALHRPKIAVSGVLEKKLGDDGEDDNFAAKGNFAVGWAHL